MAHMMKYTKASCGHMFAHYDRKAENISNENVDRSKSEQNYNLASHQQMEQGDFIKKRCSEVRCQNRKDVNVMVSWVVTAPKTLPEDEQKRFFKSTYDFLEKRYGKENVISSYVHVDEIQPHMHFAFVPVVPDSKRGGYKVSAKEKVDRNDLRTFHNDLQAHLEQSLGHTVDILNQATREGNKSIVELKRASAQERLNKVNKKAEQIISNASEQVKVLQAEADGLKRDILTAQQVKDIPHSKSLIGDKQLVDAKDFEALCRTAAMAENLMKEIKPARKINAQSKQIIENSKNQANDIITQAKNKANSVEEKLESNKLKKKLQHIEDVFVSDADVYRAFKKSEQELEKKRQQAPALKCNKGLIR